MSRPPRSGPATLPAFLSEPARPMPAPTLPGGACSAIRATVAREDQRLGRAHRCRDRQQTNDSCRCLQERQAQRQADHAQRHGAQMSQAVAQPTAPRFQQQQRALLHREEQPNLDGRVTGGQRVHRQERLDYIGDNKDSPLHSAPESQTAGAPTRMAWPCTNCRTVPAARITPTSARAARLTTRRCDLARPLFLPP